MPADSITIGRRLLVHGLVVFLLGLSSGLAMIGPLDLFQNLRLALSAHLVGVASGMFLLLIGLVVERASLSPRPLTAMFWLALIGAYGNWGGTMLAAIWGTRTMTTVAAQASGPAAAEWQEAVVGLTLISSGMGTFVACILLIVGLRSAARIDRP